MKITDDLWNGIIAETRAGIERWNTRLAERSVTDRLTVSVEATTGHTILLTVHRGEYCREGKAVARENATGELRGCRLKVDRKAGFQVGIKTSDPKNWARLTKKPADKMVKELGLLNYVIPIGSRLVEVTDTPRV
jgi:hypothetical protein